jgi:hypothetical protein
MERRKRRDREPAAHRPFSATGALERQPRADVQASTLPLASYEYESSLEPDEAVSWLSLA